MARAKRRPKIQKPPILFDQTQKIIARIEAKLGGPLLAYWSSANGSVCQDDVVVMYDHCRSVAVRDEPLGLFIKSAGGSGRAARAGLDVVRPGEQADGRFYVELRRTI